ncbi:hypothetical protein [Mycoplasma sp. MV126]|uniref:hypothetical protein n=2 Tax=unclassified Mycoplasma TaxID=2683645 RepID=UPI003AAE68B7
MKKIIEPWKKFMLAVLFFNIALLTIGVYRIVSESYFASESKINPSAGELFWAVIILLISYTMIFVFSLVIIILIAKTMIDTYEPRNCAIAIMIIQPIQIFLFITLSLIINYGLFKGMVSLNERTILERTFYPFNIDFFVTLILQITCYVVFLPSALKK